MTFILTRVDYANVGVTSRRTTCIFAPEGNQPQKFVIGDHDGVLHIFGDYFHDKLFICIIPFL
jgi:Bardet-Biedl syndrome 7 protein